MACPLDYRAFLLMALACFAALPIESQNLGGRSASGEEGRVSPRGPVTVPMDSWVYPALARLAALGYIRDSAFGQRPWTREECIRQITEAETTRDFEELNSSEAVGLIRALRNEFARDGDFGNFVELESAYTRFQAISGKPLIDGYNFGQTVINDYGRPYSEGANAVSGLSVVAQAGRFSFYTRGEWQHSPPFVSPALELKPEVHQLEPVLPGSAGDVNRFRPLEVYAGLQLGGWSLTVGKQDLWWGPGEAGPLSFSNNAEPFYSFRFTSEAPIVLPGPLRFLGAFRLDLIGGDLSGHHTPAKPLLNGQKLTWNVTKDIEIGFTRWSLFDGAGVHAFTAQSVIRNLFANGATFGSAIDPGDRKSGFDFRWRTPWRGLTIYGDFYADDEPSPLTSPPRSAFSPGIYVPSLPWLKRWDLRVEAPSTRLAGDDQGGFFLYWNSIYNDANTNKGNVLGSWVGRDGRGLWADSTYWDSGKPRIQIGYRQNRIGPAFLTGGGTQDDAYAATWLEIAHDCVARVGAQYERYHVPSLGPARSDLMFSFEVTYRPHWMIVHNQPASTRYNAP